MLHVQFFYSMTTIIIVYHYGHHHIYVNTKSMKKYMDMGPVYLIGGKNFLHPSNLTLTRNIRKYFHF